MSRMDFRPVGDFHCRGGMGAIGVGAGVGMIALVNQDIQFTVDILSYCQTLPVK